ncbi:barstar family protein [Nocardia xishanensis]|uniref:barstar family protein n=1 Tax=Nocardia xishanensis TaxID=238964 RepID=UPI0033CFCB2C
MESLASSEVFTPNRPWIHFRAKNETEGLTEIPPYLSGLRIFLLQGSEMRELDGVFAQYSREFEFPAYFGWNWPAFAECLTGLESLPSRGYVTLIHDAEQVLSDESGELRTFERILNETGRSWANKLGLTHEWGDGPVAFNTIFLTT